MIEDTKDQEVFFLGQEKRNPSRRERRKVSLIVTLVMMLIVCGYFMVYFYWQGGKKAEITLDAGILETVSILPEGSKMPRFNGKDDIAEFSHWMSKHLEYPTGYEMENAMVVVEFVVLKDGSLGHFKILKSSGNKAFRKKVTDLLKRSPRWEPAELAGGEKVNMKCTLPVVFKTPLKWSE